MSSSSSSSSSSSNLNLNHERGWQRITRSCGTSPESIAAMTGVPAKAVESVSYNVRSDWGTIFGLRVAKTCKSWPFSWPATFRKKWPVGPRRCRHGGLLSDDNRRTTNTHGRSRPRPSQTSQQQCTDVTDDIPV